MNTHSKTQHQDYEIVVDGNLVTVPDEGLTLLDVLREQLGIRSVKDGCSPQGQCGCCTVLVDGQPRVACVTPAKRVAGRAITTLDGLDADVREAWAQTFASTGASQCGFCTPGIICRFVGLQTKGADHTDRSAAARALSAHLCRCTGWQPILDAWQAYPVVRQGDAVPVRKGDSDLRAAIEGRSPQSTGVAVALGAGGFADDTAPSDALVAVRAGTDCETADSDGWVVAATAHEARRLACQVPGRRTTASFEPPLEVPPGDWDLTLRTSWVDPGYLETDAAWCEPGGEPASPLGNAGAFGAKLDSPVAAAARRLADRHGRAVRVLWSRRDSAALGAKRPPIAAGVNRDGSGQIVVARTEGITEAIKAYAPSLSVTEVDLPGPPTSSRLRAAGWAEAAVLMTAVCGGSGWITCPGAGSARATVTPDGTNGTISVSVRAGRPLDETVLRSYCSGAAHMAYSWVLSEALGVDRDGKVHDLTVRSFGIVSASAMPRVDIEVIVEDSEPVNGSDAVFAAVASAVWISRGLPPVWPVGLSSSASSQA